MKSRASIIQQDNRLMISGDLDFQSVISLWQQCQSLFANCSELNFDLSQVNSVNSAGLALLIEWVKYAKKNQKAIRFAHIPAQLMSIAEAAGIKSLLAAL